MKTSTHTSAQSSRTPARPAATPDESAFTQGRQVSRRAALAGLGLGSLSALVAPAMLGGSPAYAASGEQEPTRVLVEVGNGDLAQPGPYSVQATCLLTEDWFQTDDVLIDDDSGDRIVPFTTQAGDVEALVLTLNQDATRSLAHFYRDITQQSGWGYVNIDTGFTTVTDMSVASVAGQAPVALVSGDASESIEKRSILTLQDGAWKANPVSAGVVGDNYAGVAHDGSWFFYVLSTGTQGKDMTVHVALYTAGEPNGAVVFSATDLAPPTVSMVYDPLGMYGRLVMFTETSPGVGRIDMFPQDGTTTFSTRYQNVTTEASALLGAYGQGTDPQIDILWQDTSGNLTATEILDTGISTLQLGSTAGALGTGAVATWKQADAYTFVVVIDEVAQLIAQEPGSSGWHFLNPVPLLPASQVFSVATDPSQSTLFAVDIDKTLSVLTLGSTGWTQTLAHRPAATLQEVTCWNTAITVLDSNGAGVSGGQMQISTDRPVAFWQSTGSTLLDPGAPVTMTSEGAGKLSVSIPVNELDTAVLTVQALDSTGEPSGDPFTVNPDTDVQKFMNGTGSLQAIGQLTGTALLNATNASWDVDTHSSTGSDPLLPNLTAVPAGQQPGVATDLAAAMNHIAALPTMKQADNGIQSASMDLTATAPAFKTSSDPNAFDSLIDVDTNWWSIVEHEADSVFHGLRHGATNLHRLVSKWDSDTEQWTLNLVVTIGNDVEHLIQFAVTEVEHAIHAISAFVHALGADLKDFWNWLKRNVMELLKDSDANAKIIEGWFAPFLTHVTTAVNAIDVDVDTFFDGLEATIDTEIDNLAAAFEDAVFGSTAPVPPPTKDTGSDNSLLFKDAGDIIKFFNHGPATWLLDKLQKYLPTAPSNGGPVFPSPDQVLADLFADLLDAADLIAQIATTAWDGIKPLVTNADTFDQASMGAFFTALKACVADAVTLIEAVLKTLFDAIDFAFSCLAALLTYEFPVVPLIGGVLEMAGIDVTLSIQRIVSLMAAFPATLITQILGTDQLFPSDNQPSGALGDRPLPRVSVPAARGAAVPIDGWAFGLGVVSACVQSVWAINDAFLDEGAVLNKQRYKTTFQGNTLTTVLDLLCPTLLLLLQWPAPATSDNMTQPFWKGTMSDGNGVDDKVGWMIFTAVLPVVAGLMVVAPGSAKPAVPSPTPETTYFADYGVATICTISGIANTVLSSLYGHEQGVTDFDLAAGVLANLSYDVAWMGFPSLNTGSDYNIPAIVKCFIDLAGNFGTSMTMSAQAHAAWIGPVSKRIPL